MATLREIKRRISGVKSTEKITKAMKMVAAAKLRRAQTSLIAARPYSKKISDLMRHIASGTELDENPFVLERPVNAVAIIVVAADRGFCGSFNSNIAKATIEHVQRNYPELLHSDRLKLFAVGRKAYNFFSKRNYEIAGNFSGVFHDLSYSTAKRIADQVVKGYLGRSYDRVDVIYNEFKSVIHQKLVVDRFLPIQKEALKSTTAQSGHEYVNLVDLGYIYEPSLATILESLVPRYLEFQIWRMLLESNAAGEGARMAAMDSASENATELISTLSLQYNKARQAAITKELLEVVSGAEALTAAG